MIIYIVYLVEDEGHLNNNLRITFCGQTLQEIPLKPSF